MVSNFHQQSNDLTSRFGLAKPMRFQQQAQFHDETAVPLVRQYLETTWGCTTYLDGKETRDPPVSEQLYAENPDLNYDPDIQAQHPHWSKLVEVKSESPNYNNFAIHVDSWEATKRLNANHPLAFTACVTMDQDILSCWPEAIPDPSVIFVPKRGEWQTTIQRLKSTYPTANIRPIAYRPVHQSGGPFFTIPKHAEFLRPITDFVAVELLGWPVEWWKLAQPGPCERCGVDSDGWPECVVCGADPTAP